MQPRKIKVLIVDDSAVVRKVVNEALALDPEIEVVGTAADPYIARDKIIELQPDVMTLDIEMPRMDGLRFLEIIMKHKPMPVIIMSSLTQAGSEYALRALQLGAVEVLAKPSSAYSIGELADQLREVVKNAAQCSIRNPAPAVAPSPTTSSLPPKVLQSTSSYSPRHIILLGASTGGTEALKDVLTQLPADVPGICIVQHIPAYFSKAFADRLNQLCKISVREAVDGDVVQPGLALVAPGDFHMLLRWRGTRYEVQLKKGPMVWHQRPAVDVLFSSAAECVDGFKTTVGLLTGMGKDGAEGMLKLRQRGAHTFAQNEESCVVFGMPRSAMEIGAAEKMVHLRDFPRAIMGSLA